MSKLAMISIPMISIPLLLLGVPSLALAGQYVSFDQLPPPVQATVQQETQGGQIVEIERKTKRRGTSYAIEFFQSDDKFEIKVAADGTLLKRKLDRKNVPFHQLPQAVQATVQQEVQGGRIVGIEREDKRRGVFFEIEFFQNEVKFEIEVAADGSLIRRKVD